MKFIGRKISNTKLLNKGFTFFKLMPRLFILKHPFAILKHYINKDSPEFIDLKSGVRIFLSSHPHDIITFFVVFLKKDYGNIKANSVLVDVGANIGIFSLFAALSGAKKVYAFEPSKEAFQILCENVRFNGLTDTIIPINKAVSNTHEATIKFPYSSSPYNKIESRNVNNQEYCEIQTVNLGSFIDKHADTDNIDLLKLDCEGSEFNILPSINETALAKIKSIRMECHGQPRELIEYLSQKGYVVDRIKGDDIWLIRRSIK